jgi:hypothetical protein
VVPLPAPDDDEVTAVLARMLSAAGKLLAEKSANLGRVYAVMGLTNERALLLQAADAVA